MDFALHEDDAERAVRSGLELVAAVGQLKTHALLQTRVGIATGLVVVGDLIGSGASQEQAIVGETPNFAARLQGLAEPNSVVIAESTRNDLEDLGAQDLKGVAGPVQAWAALRPASVESRFEALHDRKQSTHCQTELLFTQLCVGISGGSTEGSVIGCG
jgi:class 3 adenylate cyclase